MPNHIRRVLVTDLMMNPAQAHIAIDVYPEEVTPSIQLRGRLMGPRSPYASTVEVAYPITTLQTSSTSSDGLKIRSQVVIPEPSLWDTISPFVYEGPLQLWDQDQCCDQVRISHGLRMLHLEPRGLRVNNQSVFLNGLAASQFSDDDARSFRKAGINSLLAPVRPEAEELWSRAAFWGFLVIGRISDLAEVSHVSAFTRFTSALGYVVPLRGHNFALATLFAELKQHIAGPVLLGVETDKPVSEPLPDGLSFMLCPKPLLSSLISIPLPKIIRTERRLLSESDRTVAGEFPGVVGSICDFL